MHVKNAYLHFCSTYTRRCDFNGSNYWTRWNSNWLFRKSVADDTVSMSDNIDQLQNILDRIIDSISSYGLRINIDDKTKCMVVQRKSEINEKILMANGCVLERVPKFEYLSIWFNEDTDRSTEIRTRIERVMEVFLDMTKKNRRDN